MFSSNICVSLPKICDSSSQYGLAFLTVNFPSCSCSLFCIWGVIFALPMISLIARFLVYSKFFQNFYSDCFSYLLLKDLCQNINKYMGHSFLYMLLPQYQHENKHILYLFPKDLWYLCMDLRRRKCLIPYVNDKPQVFRRCCIKSVS